MKLFELDERDIEDGFYSVNRDKIDGRDIGDTRKQELTLRKLNKLKKTRALKSLDQMKRQDLLGVMYGDPEGDSGGGGFGF